MVRRRRAADVERVQSIHARRRIHRGHSPLGRGARVRREPASAQSLIAPSLPVVSAGSAVRLPGVCRHASRNFRRPRDRKNGAGNPGDGGVILEGPLLCGPRTTRKSSSNTSQKRLRPDPCFRRAAFCCPREEGVLRTCPAARTEHPTYLPEKQAWNTWRLSCGIKPRHPAVPASEDRDLVRRRGRSPSGCATLPNGSGISQASFGIPLRPLLERGCTAPVARLNAIVVPVADLPPGWKCSFQGPPDDETGPRRIHAHRARFPRVSP